MKIVYKITLFPHLLIYFFLFLSYVARFGFTSKALFANFVHVWPGANHLAGLNAQVDGCAIGFSCCTCSL